MGLPMPPVVVLIVCRVLFVGGEDENSRYTQWRNTEWAYEHSKMVCRRHEIQVYDTEGDNRAFSLPACQRTIPRLAAQFDVDYRDKPWRFWRGACPVPTVNTVTGEVIGWTLPDCGHRDTVVCEVDSVI